MPSSTVVTIFINYKDSGGFDIDLETRDFSKCYIKLDITCIKPDCFFSKGIGNDQGNVLVGYLAASSTVVFAYFVDRLQERCQDVQPSVLMLWFSIGSVFWSWIFGGTVVIILKSGKREL